MRGAAVAIGGLEFGAALGVPLALTAGLTPLVRHYAMRRQVVDAPDGGRKTQAVAIPYLGGLAILGGILGTLVLALAVDGYDRQTILLLAGVLGPGLALAVVGLLDDLKGLTPASRFVAQSTAGVVTALVMALTGTRGSLTGMVWLDSLFVVLWVVGVTNALNLIDNMDGLSSGTAAAAGLSFAAIAGANGQYLVAALSLTVAGAALGFLLWNKYPASIYMGDSGALFLGFVLAAIAIRIDLAGSPRPVAFAIPLLVLALPILDTSLVIVSRLQRGLSPFTGGRDHLSHRLLRLGRRVPTAAGILWGAAGVAGGVAYLGSIAPAGVAAALLAGSAVVFVVSYLYMLRLPATDEE